MNNTAERKTRSRAEREADLRAARRAEQATIVAGLKTALEADEQLLGFARGRIAGGFRGKLNVGPEAFFAPIVNIGLTERRLVLQHIHPENGRPSEILPHFYALSEIASLAFSDIETYGAEPACRLVVHMTNDLFCRLRLRGQTNFESAQSIAEVFTSLTGPRRTGFTPTQRVCPQCTRMLDQPYKFCPYCGQQQPLEAQNAATTAEAETATPAPQPQDETLATTESLPSDISEETAPANMATVAEAIPTVEAAAEEARQTMGTPFLPELPVAETEATPEQNRDDVPEVVQTLPEEPMSEQNIYEGGETQSHDPFAATVEAPGETAETDHHEVQNQEEQNQEEQNYEEQKDEPQEEQPIHYHDDTQSQGEF
jgi:hypothetical protein